MDTPTDLTTLQPWILRPGDKVVLQSNRAVLSIAEIADVRARWREQFGDIPVMIVGSGWNVAAIIRAEEQPTPEG